MPHGLSEFCGINLHNLGFGEADEFKICHRVFHAVLEDLQGVIKVFCADKDLRDGALFGGSLFVNADKRHLCELTWLTCSPPPRVCGTA